MSDPIGRLMQGGGTGGVPGAADIARRLAELREAGGAQGGGATGTQGITQGDEARRYTIDVGADKGASFGDTLKRALSEVSGAQDRANSAVEQFVRGEPVELHQVMAATEEAEIALEMLVELRNKLTDAYRTVVNMQS